MEESVESNQPYIHVRNRKFHHTFGDVYNIELIEFCVAYSGKYPLLCHGNHNNTDVDHFNNTSQKPTLTNTFRTWIMQGIHECRKHNECVQISQRHIVRIRQHFKIIVLLLLCLHVDAQTLCGCCDVLTKTSSKFHVRQGIRSEFHTYHNGREQNQNALCWIQTSMFRVEVDPNYRDKKRCSNVDKICEEYESIGTFRKTSRARGSLDEKGNQNVHLTSNEKCSRWPFIPMITTPKTGH